MRTALIILALSALSAFGQAFSFNDHEAWLAQQKAASGGGAASFSLVRWVHTYPGASAGITNTAGNTLLVWGGGKPATSPTISDTKGNTYTLVNSGTANSLSYGAVWAAFGIASGSNYITWSGTGETDYGITVLEISGASSVDTSIIVPDGSSTGMTFGATAALFEFWCNESTDGITSVVLNPGSINGTQIQHDAGQYDASYSFLNGGSGYPAGSYTLLNSAGGANAIWIAVTLK